jgi:hypothetical protein
LHQHDVAIDKEDQLEDQDDHHRHDHYDHNLYNRKSYSTNQNIYDRQDKHVHHNKQHDTLVEAMMSSVFLTEI